MKYNTNTFLDNFIHHISFNEFQDDENNDFIPVIPDCMTELVFNFGNSYYRKHPINNLEYNINSSHIIGLKTKACFLKLNKNLRTVSIRFLPGALSYFVKLDLKEICDSVIEAEYIFGKEIHILEDKLSNSDNEEALSLLIEFLTSKYSENFEHKNLNNIIKSMYYSNTYNLNNLIRFNSDYKKIERLFYNKIGTTPKKFQEIIRFNKSTKLIHNTKNNFTDIALNLGYYDQSHFNKKFKELSGFSPKKYQRLNIKMLKSNQEVINSLLN